MSHNTPPQLGDDIQVYMHIKEEAREDLSMQAGAAGATTECRRSPAIPTACPLLFYTDNSTVSSVVETGQHVDHLELSSKLQLHAAVVGLRRQSAAFRHAGLSPLERPPAQLTPQQAAYLQIQHTKCTYTHRTRKTHTNTSTQICIDATQHEQAAYIFSACCTNVLLQRQWQMYCSRASSTANNTNELHSDMLLVQGSISNVRHQQFAVPESTSRRSLLMFFISRSSAAACHLTALPPTHG
jgi:hypothetical protein